MSIQNTNLKDFFPMIRKRSVIQEEITQSPTMSSTFGAWEKEKQDLFLDICSGARGAKMLYDCFFKEILSPEHVPERLSSLLSELLGKKVTVKQVLPNDSERIADELSLIITDIVVELEDGSIANVEVQKIGYAFPGERASCYTADLLLRQYKRVRDERRDKFSYKDLAPVYTIIIMEKSPHIFSEFPDEYKHYIYGTSDTGIKLNLLENIIFVNVDIFLNKLHNDGINTKLEAWLTFLGCDEPAYIVELITKYPEFKPLYSHLYDMCRNIEGVMNMFSKELQLMDRNTVKYMIDEYQEKLDTVKEELNSTTEQLNSTTEQLNSTTEQLNSTKEQLDTAQTTITEKDDQIADLNSVIAKLQKELDDLKNTK